jgi:tRNA(Ile)-lysidine synthase
MHRTEKIVLDFIRTHELVSRGDRVVVAVSGGADSVSLLNILHNIRIDIGIELHVAHLDHGLRGEASRADAQFVSTRASELNLPTTIEERDVATYRKQNHLSLEEAAREVRYQFLEEVVRRAGGSSVAVAHTLDDHVETVILHLLRGSGLTGLMGLKAKSQLSYKRVGPLNLIRPLLCLSRDDVEKYCDDLKLEYQTDGTNESLSFTRNRIRHKLLPQLREDFNPRVNEAFTRLSKLASDDIEFMNLEAIKATTLIVRFEGDRFSIDRSMFRCLHPAMKRAVLRQLLSSALGGLKDIEAIHIEDMLNLAEGETGRSIDLPAGVKFNSGYKELTLGPGTEMIPIPHLDAEHSLNIPGITEIPGWRITASVTEGESEFAQPNSENTFVQSFDLGVAGTSLTVRPRKTGDRFHPLGMVTEKSIKDFFIDARVPRSRRSRVPIVVNPCQTLWVVGYRIDERAKVNGSTRNVLKLKFELTSKDSTSG